MIERPRLKSHLSAHPVPPDELFLLGDDRQHLIESKAAVRIVPLLDGSRSSTDIALELSTEFSLGEVMGALAALQRGGHLADGNGAEAGDEAAWWEATGADPIGAAARVSASAVQIATVGDVPNAEAFASSLREAGLAVSDSIDAAPAEGSISLIESGGDTRLVLTEDYLAGTLAELNGLMFAEGKSWLLAKPVGETLWLGPHFRPGQTGCWACLSFRLWRNRHVETYIQRRIGERPRRPSATPPGAAQAAAGLLARELASIAFTGGSEPLDGRILTLRRDLGTLSHELIRRPQCPVCGKGTDAYGGPEVRLTPNPKRITAGGAYRSMSAEQTLDVLEKHVSPITGAVAWVADLTEPGDSGHAFWAGHWFPILGSERGAAVLRQNVRGRSGGKGSTPTQARASAICESLERYSGVYFGDEPRVRATREEMGEKVLPFEEIVLYSEFQYDHRDEWNRSNDSVLQIIPERLTPDREIDWSQVWSLSSDEPRVVPTAVCYYGHPDIADFNTFFCTGDSNGQGAGNTLEEAITQGLMELVERDGVAIWWYNRAPVPAVDLDSFSAPWLERTRAEYAAVGREVWALDLTTDIDIPVFVACSRRVDERAVSGAEPEDLIFGFGAHLEPRLALERAFSELNQFLPAVRRDPETNEYMLDDPEAVEWWTGSSLESEPHLSPPSGLPPRVLADFPERGSDDLATDIRTCVDLLGAAGLETFALDQSRPDIELRVAKVFAPGMRHFWRRLREGRLYDVPVKLGRLEAPLREDQLNPKNIWF